MSDHLLNVLIVIVLIVIVLVGLLYYVTGRID